MSTIINGPQITTNDAGEQNIFAMVAGRSEPLLAHESHPNWKAIMACVVEKNFEGFADLFDIPAAIERKFARLSERVTAKNGRIYFDGDEAHGAVIEAILGFMDSDEDVAPLVNFYEKLTTNPLGNVQDGVYSWITGQKSDGNFTITPDGDILGYKSVRQFTPEWREGEDVVYVPSRRGEGIVNGREVGRDEFIEQVPGDVVEMPRSRVLNEPSLACGDGLHIGTWNYARTFTGDTVLLVRFSPRDIVSLPDDNSTWKLRVCRYTVVGPVDGPLDVPVYPDVELEFSDERADFTAAEFSDDDDVVDAYALVADLETQLDELEAANPDAVYGASDDVWEKWENELERLEDELGSAREALDAILATRNVEVSPETVADLALDNEVKAAEAALSAANVSFGTGSAAASRAQDRLDEAVARKHGKGGPTSQAAKGRGRNPAQDTEGRFSAGRPGSQRGADGRFAG